MVTAETSPQVYRRNPVHGYGWYAIAWGCRQNWHRLALTLIGNVISSKDEIVARLAGALNAQLVATEARRAEQATNPDSMDLYFQGMAWLNKGAAPKNVAQARTFYERALAADPDNVDALTGSARADIIEGHFIFVTDPTTAFFAAEAKLTKALSSVPDHPRGHMLSGLVDIFTKRAARGIAECEHSLALDRNLVQAHSAVGLGKIFIGRAEENEAHVAEALSLSPRDTLAYVWMTNAGLGKLHLGGWEQAVAWFRRAIEANRNNPQSTVFVSRCPRAAWPIGRGAFRDQDRSHAQSAILSLPRPRRLDDEERRSHVPGPA